MNKAMRFLTKLFFDVFIIDKLGSKALIDNSGVNNGCAEN